MTLRNFLPVLTATAFALIGLIGLIVYGTDMQRNLAILAALLGCVSQFAVQDPRPIGRWVNIIAAYAGFVLIAIAVAIGLV